jgi:DNA-binding SARP family transcriptional activator
MAYALERDINPPTASRIVAAMRFDPPPYLPESWPWTVRLYAFGTPAIELDGAMLGGKARAQARPIELLLGIALAGNLGGGATIAVPGSSATARTDAGVDAHGLMLALWPDADADAKTAFDVTLLRLRKLLVHDGLVTLTDGKLRLDRRRVWCDAWAFEGRVDAAEALSPADALSLVRLYRGPLFGDLGDLTTAAWAASVRERLRSKFLRTIARAGAEAERLSDWNAAIALYERGIEQDTLAEDFYRGLMRCHLALGAPANALRVYRRCRELLSIVLAVAPTAETEALHRKIHA